jgi:hypothetical protein
MTKRKPSISPGRTGKKQANNTGRFRPGISGNPAGLPKGFRHPKTVLMQAMLDEDGPAIIRKAIAMARNGNPVALKLILDRLLPPQKSRTVDIELSPIEGAGDVHTALQVVTRAVASGAISPEEGASIATMIGQHRTTLEVTELARQLEALETLVRKR